FCYASSTFGRMVGVMKGIPSVVHDFDTQIYFPYPLYGILGTFEKLATREWPADPAGASHTGKPIVPRSRAVPT
ncbi:MAG: hypothetical protein ACREYC_19155, partial [Gammaproteobacteria bacterium]